jgi:hypothetical protein
MNDNDYALVALGHKQRNRAISVILEMNDFDTCFFKGGFNKKLTYLLVGKVDKTVALMGYNMEGNHYFLTRMLGSTPDSELLKVATLIKTEGIQYEFTGSVGKLNQQLILTECSLKQLQLWLSDII